MFVDSRISNCTSYVRQPSLDYLATCSSYCPLQFSARARTGIWSPCGIVAHGSHTSPLRSCRAFHSSACESSGQWQAAIGLLDEMTRRGLQPDVISFTTLITACARGRQWQKALAVFADMKVATTRRA